MASPPSTPASQGEDKWGIPRPLPSLLPFCLICPLISGFNSSCGLHPTPPSSRFQFSGFYFLGSLELCVWLRVVKLPKQTLCNKKTPKTDVGRHYYLSNFLWNLRPRSSQRAGELDSSLKSPGSKPSASRKLLPRNSPANSPAPPGLLPRPDPKAGQTAGAGLSRPGVANTAPGEGAGGRLLSGRSRGGCQAARLGFVFAFLTATTSRSVRAATPARRAVTARGSPAFSPAPGMPRGRAWAWRGRRGAPACPSPSKVKSTAAAPRLGRPPALTEPRSRDPGPAACERAGGHCQRRCPSSRRSSPEPAPAPIYGAGPALRARLTRHVTAASPGPSPRPYLRAATDCPREFAPSSAPLGVGSPPREEGLRGWSASNLTDRGQ